ncbi:hypothetical protein [Brevibacillus nitrificans]|uniref:hypothetical protein n=1 Tax=Brevibacillus nitrificans TaxID=651560 RepID=UPI0028577F18|nr:hypothetical protein [Brevibacillus nitrificans]MDR7318914.1 hypothetical protein [Brevibacillus nitrificans]
MTRKLEAAAKDAAAAEKKQKNQLIYIGPSLPGGILAQNTVFRDGVPKHLDEIRKQQPQIDALIVPIAQFSEAQAQLQRKGTAEQQAFRVLSRKEQSNGI